MTAVKVNKKALLLNCNCLISAAEVSIDRVCAAWGLTMKKLCMIFILFFVISNAYAEFGWTDGNWRGQGLGVNNVYLQWDLHWVAFTGSDGKDYYYHWGVGDTPDEKGKLFFTMLMTAFTANKKVSILRDDVSSHGGWYEYTFINLHN